MTTRLDTPSDPPATSDFRSGGRPPRRTTVAAPPPRTALACVALLGLLLASPSRAATITVDTTSDATGGPDCTLRDAISAANTDAAVGGCATGMGADVIVFSLPAASTRVITLTAQDNFWYGPNALPPIYTDVTIDGGTEGIVVERGAGAPKMRFFYVAGTLHPVPAAATGISPGTLTLRRLTLRGGLARGGHGGHDGGGGAGLGGAVYNQGTLNLDQVLATGNVAEGGGSSSFGSGGGGLGGDGGSRGGGGFRENGTSEGGGFLAAEGGSGGSGGTSTIGGDGTDGTIPAGGDGGGFQPMSDGGGVGGGGGGGGGFGGGGGGGFGGGGGGGGVGGGGGSGTVGGGGGLGVVIFNHFGTVSVTNSTLTANAAQGGGGGGSAGEGGGGGGAGLGGAVFNLDGSVTIESSTLAGNRATGGQGGGDLGEDGQGRGGAVFNHFENVGVGNDLAMTTTATIRLEDSILADSVDAPEDCFNNDVAPSVTPMGNNLIETNGTAPNACASPTQTGDPMLGPLQDNGGPTQTLALLDGSPALDAAGACPPPLADQRGLPRPIDAGGGLVCDLGAFERLVSHFSVSGATASEGTGGATTFDFTVTRDTDIGTASVEVATADGSATAATDYTAFTGLVVAFAGGETVHTVSVSIVPDSVVEPDETFTVMLSNPSADAVIDVGTATGTILDDDTAQLGIAGVSVAEGTGGTTAFAFDVTLAGGVQGGLGVAYTTDDGSATLAAGDYLDNDGSLAFSGAPGQVQTVTVQVVGDAVVEPDETFTVALGAISGLAAGIDPAAISLAGSPATGTILDDDTAQLGIAGTTVVEGTGGTTAFAFDVTLSGSVQGGLGVAYTTDDGTATLAAGDYLDNDGSLAFSGAPGQVQTVTVQVVGDTVVEPDETFTVALGAISGLAAGIDPAAISLSGSPATGTIVNDDDLSMLAAVKTVAGDPTVGATITYTIVVTNPGPGDQADSPGDEMVDVLPPELALIGAVADTGTAAAAVPSNTVTWNGALAAGASATIVIEAEVLPAARGTLVANQASVFFDIDRDGRHDGMAPSDDPGAPGSADPTVFVVGVSVLEIPTLDVWALVALGLALAWIAVLRLRP